MKLLILRVLTVALAGVALSAQANTATKKAKSPAVKTAAQTQPTLGPTKKSTSHSPSKKSNSRVAKTNPKKAVTKAMANPSRHALKPVAVSSAASSVAPQTQSVTTSVKAQPSQTQKKLTNSLNVSRSNSLYDKEDGSEQASWNFSVSSRYQINAQYSAGVVIEAFHDIKDETQSDFSRAQLNLRRHGLDTKYVGFTGNLNLGLPVSKGQNLASLRSSLGLGLRGDLKPEVHFSEKLSSSFSLGLTRNIHEFETGANGQVNTAYIFSQSIGAGWALTEKWSLSADLAYIMTESYQGLRKELYSHSQSLGFKQNELIAYSLTHSFGGPGISIYQPDGRSLEFELTDEDNSFVSGTVTVTF